MESAADKAILADLRTSSLPSVQIDDDLVWKLRMLTIVSGGQTGADRAALDWALSRGVEHSGWCPRGRLAEDGAIPQKYNLRETLSNAYPERTRRNIQTSDVTLIFITQGPLEGGSLLTERLAQQASKPYLVLRASTGVPQSIGELKAFLASHKSKRIINVAGQRGSKAPLLGRFVHAVLDGALLSS